MADDVIRLDFDINSQPATKSADQFIANLERKFQQLKGELGKALADGVVDGSESKKVQALTKEVDKLDKELKQLKTTGDSSGKSISKLGVAFSALGGVVAGLGLQKIAQGFIQLAKDAFTATAALEQTTNALESLVAREFVQTGQFDNLQDALGASSEKAQELLQFIRELARQSPFSREQIQSAFQTALAYGFTIEEAQRLTQATVDLAAASGKGAEATGRIALALGQIQAKGKVSAEELNQLREAGLNVNPILEGLGFTLDDITKGLVGADTFIEAVVVSLERDFGGAAARATNSLAGLVSTLGDLRTDALIAFFEPALKELQPQLADFAEGFNEATPSIREAGIAFGQLIALIAEEAPTAIEIVNGISTAFEGLAKFIGVVKQVQEFRNTEFLGLKLGELPLNPLGAIADSLQDIDQQTNISSAVKDAVGSFFETIKRTARENIPGLEESLGVGNLIAEAFEKSLEGSLESIDLQSVAQDELRDKIQQTDTVRKNAIETQKEEVESAKLLAQAQRELVIELVKSSSQADKNAVAIFEQAEAAGASGDQLRGLAIELGILTDEQIQAQTVLNELTLAFVRGDITAEQFKLQAADLANVISGTALATAQAAISIDALNSAFNKAISPSKRRGGGGRANNAERDDLLQQAADIEAQATAIEGAISRFGDIARLDADALSELIDNSRDFGDELFDLTQQAGASIDTLIELGVATGEFTEEQAKAALEVIQRERGIKAIAEALASQTISTEQATEAAAELNRQIAEGEQVDLSAFGIDVAALDTSQVPALLRESAQAAKEAAEALTQIAGALGGVADGSESVADAIKRTTAQQKLQSAETLQQKVEAIALANAFGLLEESEVNQLVQLALLEEVNQRGILTNEQLSEALSLVADEGYTVADALKEVGVSADDIPTDIDILIESNSDDVIRRLTEIEAFLNELERQRTITLVVNREEITTATGGTGAGSVPVPEDTTEFALGGYTGRGNPRSVAGVVHSDELVVPSNVLKKGIASITAYAAANVPNLRDSVVLSNPSPVQSAILPNTTYITNTTSGDRITSSSVTDTNTVNNFYGVAGKEIARAVFNTEFRQRHNRSMKRNIVTSALT